MSTTEASNDTRRNHPLLRYARRLIGARRLIVAATGVAACAAIVVALLLPVTYESSATLILLPPPFKTAEAELSNMLPRVLNVPDYELLLTSDGTLQSVAERVKLLADWPEEDKEQLSQLSSLRKRMRVTTEVVEKTAYGTSHSPVIVLTARAARPEYARDLAEAWAAVAEQLANNLYAKGKTGVKDFVEERFTTARADLFDVSAAIRDVEIEYNDELAGARLQNKHGRLLSYEEKVDDLEMQIASVEEELRSLRSDLEEEPEKKRLWRSPPTTALFLRERALSPTETDEGVQLPGYEEEVLNETFIYLTQKIQLKESELAGMLEYRSRLQAELETLDQELQELRAEMANRNYERKQLDLQQLPLQSSYELLAGTLEQVKIVETEQENLADIKVVSEPVVPDDKVWPPRSLIVLAGAAMGVMLSAGSVVARDLADDYDLLSR